MSDSTLKHILFIVSNYPHASNRMAGVFYQRVIEELVLRGHQVSVIAPYSRIKRSLSALRASLNRKQEAQIPELTQKPGLNIYRPEYFPWPRGMGRSLLVSFLFKAVKRMISKYDIKFDLVDARGAYPWCFIGKEVAQQAGKPLISTFIGSDINVEIQQNKRVHKKVEEVVGFSAAVVTVSDDLRRIIQEEYGRSRVEVVYDGIDFSALKRAEEKNWAKINDDKLTCGFVGHLSDSKGCDVLLELIKRSTDSINWLIVGKGPYYQRFAEFSNVELKGLLAPEKVLQVYQEMAVFVFPSKNEGIPNVVKEAAFYKLPVIASKVGGIPEAMDHGRFGISISNYNDPNEFWEAILKVQANRTHFKTNAKEHSRFIEQHFDIKNTVSQLEHIYSTSISTRQTLTPELS